MELLHDTMEGRDYGQLKDLISDTCQEEMPAHKALRCHVDLCSGDQRAVSGGDLLADPAAG